MKRLLIISLVLLTFVFNVFAEDFSAAGYGPNPMSAKENALAELEKSLFGNLPPSEEYRDVLEVVTYSAPYDMKRSGDERFRVIASISEGTIEQYAALYNEIFTLLEEAIADPKRLVGSASDRLHYYESIIAFNDKLMALRTIINALSNNKAVLTAVNIDMDQIYHEYELVKADAKYVQEGRIPHKEAEEASLTFKENINYRNELLASYVRENFVAENTLVPESEFFVTFTDNFNKVFNELRKFEGQIFTIKSTDENSFLNIDISEKNVEKNVQYLSLRADVLPNYLEPVRFTTAIKDKREINKDNSSFELKWSFKFREDESFDLYYTIGVTSEYEDPKEEGSEELVRVEQKVSANGKYPIRFDDFPTLTEILSDGALQGFINSNANYVSYKKRLNASSPLYRDMDLEKNIQGYSQGVQSLKEKFRVVSPTWHLGLEIMNPLSPRTGAERINSQFGINVGAGVLVQNIFYAGFSVIPTWASRTKYEDGKETSLPSIYYGTFGELYLAAHFRWNNTRIMAGLAVGADFETFKYLYIMPKVNFGIRFETFKPVFESANIAIGGKYTFQTKRWDLAIDVTLLGLW